MTGTVEYFRIGEDAPLPDISPYAPFRAVVVLEAPFSTNWQDLVSKWLIESGCLYMMAWGEGCSGWHDAVDGAREGRFPSGEIPDDKFVMTTWHERETLEEVFWFAEFCAMHPDVELSTTLIIHVSPTARREEMFARFQAAQDQE
ncbi:MAG TPA: hypothetical protein VH331_06765 [Allosphingosinicella sp.]|nr:hypothetical protein [Allosphingosinicella sp.]